MKILPISFSVAFILAYTVVGHASRPDEKIFSGKGCSEPYTSGDPHEGKALLEKFLDKNASHKCATHFMYARPLSATFVTKTETKHEKHKYYEVNKSCGHREYVCTANKESH